MLGVELVVREYNGVARLEIDCSPEMSVCSQLFDLKLLGEVEFSVCYRIV